MQPNIKRALISLAVLSEVGCGGTDPNKEVGNHMNMSISATSETVAGNFISVNATVTSSPSAIKNMSWTAQKTGNSPDVTLLNSDCKIKSVSTSGSTLDPVSTWSCAVDILSPVTVSANSDYRLVVNATDAKGNISSGQSILTVKPNGTPPPTVAIVGQSTIKSGEYVSYSCQASGGTTIVKDKYAYQWVVTQRNEVGNFSISSPKDPFTGQFVAPVVSQPQNVTIGCRVTDDSQKTSIAYQNITINPVTESRIVPNVLDGLTFAAGQPYKFDSTRTTWIDSVGTPLTSKEIFYFWAQKSGPTVTIANPTSASPSVLFPANISTNPESKQTYVFTLSVSDKPFENGVATSTVQAVDAVFYVSTLPPISINVGASSTFKTGTLGSASITAIGQAGYPLYYSWTQVSGPAVTIGGANRNAITFLAPPISGTDAVPLLFRVAVSYAPITAGNTNVTMTDVLVAVTP